MLCLLLLFIIKAGITKELPASFKQCNRSDPDFNSCLKNAIQKAINELSHSIPEYGLVSLHPLFISALTIPAGHNAVQFVQNYKDLKVSGFDKVVCSNVEINLDDQPFLKLKCFSSEVVMDFNYEINGKLMVLSIHGKGPGVINLEDLNLAMDFQLKRYEKDGKTHFKVTNSTLKLNPKFITIKLDNLFGGEKILSDNLNRVLNDNWKDLFHEMKPKYEAAFSEKFSSLFSNILEKVSEHELFGDI